MIRFSASYFVFDIQVDVPKYTGHKKFLVEILQL